MEWYNYFYSTPSVGICYKGERAEIPTLEKIAYGFDNTFRIERPALNKWIIEKQGLFINLEPGNIFVSKKNNININYIPGKMPEIEYQKIVDYQTALKEITVILLNTWKDLCDFSSDKKHIVGRIGFVINASMKKEEIPPGITSLLDAQNNIWGNNLDSYNLKITRNLEDEDSYSIKCHHKFKGGYSDNDLTEIELDYQYFLKEEKSYNAKQLEKIINDKMPLALSYFKDIGVKGI